MKKGFTIVAAYDKNTRGIGKNNTIPWKFTEDMKFFNSLTTSSGNFLSKSSSKSSNALNTVIMGKNTWESLPPKFKPLPDRYNLVVSRDYSLDLTEDYKNTRNFISFESAYAFAKTKNGEIFVIGGQQIYEIAIQHEDCVGIYTTEILFSGEEKSYDTFFPIIPSHFKLEREIPFQTSELSGKYYLNVTDMNSQEHQYLTLLQHIMEKGERKNDRTGIGTMSIFGAELRFSLLNNVLPLLTTKKVFWKGIVEELLFFLRGDHDNRILQAKGVHIWDGNTRGKGKNPLLDEDDLGLAYGVQWRAAGAKLESLEGNYLEKNEKGEIVSKGIDQLKEVINLLKNDPDSRRIIMTAWNPCQLKYMALVPCHMTYQFYVSEKKFLSCKMTQRSADTFLGLPFNIASTSLLVYILGKICNLMPKEVIISLGDCHIYNNHMEQVKLQLSRNCLKFPTIDIKKDLTGIEDIENLEFKDLELKNYHSHPPIKAEMAV